MAPPTSHFRTALAVVTVVVRVPLVQASLLGPSSAVVEARGCFLAGVPVPGLEGGMFCGVGDADTSPWLWSLPGVNAGGGAVLQQVLQPHAWPLTQARSGVSAALGTLLATASEECVRLYRLSAD